MAAAGDALHHLEAHWAAGASRTGEENMLLCSKKRVVL